MNCKNCGAPVDGHIACPKCGQLVDFTGGTTSYTQPKTSYGIDWAAEDVPVAEPVKETVVESKSVNTVEEKVEVVTPIVEEKKEEARLDSSESVSIFDTFSEALNDIAEDMVDLHDEIKSDLSDTVDSISGAVKPSNTYEEKEPEPYRYKEPEPYRYRDAEEEEALRYIKSSSVGSKSDEDSTPLKIVFGVFLLLAGLCAGVGSLSSNDNMSDLERAKQDAYNNLDPETMQQLNSVFMNNYSSLPTTDTEDSKLYVYADLGKIYNSDGRSIDISEDAVVESAFYHQRIAYIEDDKLYLVDGELEPDAVADGVKDFQLSPKGEDLAYINQNDYLIYRKYDTSYNVFNVDANVVSFAFSSSTNHTGFLYVKETDDGKVLYQCDKDGKNKVEIATGECIPLAVSDGLDCTFYLDENNHLHRYLSEKDSDDEYDVIINENSDYIFSDVHDDLLINNIGVDGNIYCVSKFSDELYVIDKPGLSSADICDGSYGSAGNLVATYLCNDGLIEVKFGPSGLSENIITESSNVECFATDVNGDVVLYKLDNQLYGWFRNSNSSKVIDEDASAINKISVANTREFYYLKGSELYYIYPTSTSLVPVLVSDDVDKIVKYIDNDGQVTLGFATTDFSQYILTTIGNYISK